MRKLSLTDNYNSVFEVDLVRYFSYDSEDYLIYTLNETDEKGYLKLYLVEILEELGEKVCYTINDDDNWQKMQDIIKKVIKEIKNGKRELLNDKNPLEIEKIKIVNPRYFKLDKKLVDILCLNYFENASDLSSVDIDLDELDDLVIEAIPLPDSEVIILENGEDNIMNENVKEITTPVVENNNVSDEINYKELYFALKEEKEANDKLIEEMMMQLLKYKEKYGEIE